MVRGSSIALGIALGILWIVGLSEHATGWLTWLNGLAAVCAFGISTIDERTATTQMLVGLPIALAVGLFVLWIVALAVGAEAWLAWWTFAFACCSLLIGIVGATEGQHPRVTTTTTPRMV
jgi:hypothetical protein